MNACETENTWKGRIVCPQNSHPLAISDVTLFGNRVPADVIKLRLYWSRGGPGANVMGVLISREKCGQRHTGEKTREGRHGDWNDAATRQATPEPQEARSSKEGRFPRAFRGHMVLPAPAPGTSSLQNCKTAHFHCPKPLGLWYFAQKPQKISTAPSALQLSHGAQLPPVPTTLLAN